MNTPLLIAAVLHAGWLGMLERIAILVIVVWGIWELLKAIGWTPHRVVVIIATVLVSILLVVWLFELFGLLVGMP